MHKTLLFLLCVLLSVNSFADNIITQNIINGCNSDNLTPKNNEATIYAIWQTNSYTCAPGYFLPANGIECVKCPVNYTCNGGTFIFDENISQGIAVYPIVITDFIGGCANDILFPINDRSNMIAQWERNSYDCDSGYYLPADGIECALCTENSYCSGGTYTYSENTTQGITECPSSTISNTGSSSIEQCKKTLSWDADNGLSPTSATCGYDTYISLPNTPEKTGYTFSGWALSTE